ncbi:lytic transglycosylase domain-containing protein [Salipiger marinus]|jgi:membrane-bound lytic murein transglycosylase B|uniref:Transglycosylase SLT domain-containing protein n=1 Tax=Salipiger marinus TaxID=555512 RepID=A0A1G8RYR5_9RHOB|nr:MULTISPECIES: lytic murein transglycosylase [Salipiger]HBM62159.1 murein transglycosylase [Citreicella sp.]MCD1616484.1 lytic murein transglycosylase [Salipiger manganoxidans]MEB3419026.1 lytic murein transglycosylase [Salipiger manganoxidans]SDJ22108.1 Transglycosylase SLT domain-containing protein [Salipiger marinus]HBT00798.1 murein transglycosylase [Citreicella sp.]
MPRALFKALVTATLTCSAGAALAATCGNDASGFDTWKREFAAEAQQAGVGQRGIDALMRAPYSTSTIRADRNQKGVKYALNEFIRIRLGSVDGFAATAQKRLNGNPNLYRGLEQTYGVPAGILLAIHGMETGFGRTMGDTPVVSSISTVAYDCRRSDFFTPHALAALQMVDRGMLAPDQRGAAHGELGHTQFLPGNALRYGQDGNGDGRVDFYNEADALASTANFLRAKGWQPGQPFSEGTGNFRVLNEWNAATVYQQAIALVAERIR